MNCQYWPASRQLLHLMVLQTILLVVCGWISFYFDIDDFTNRVMVVLTAMLVVATIVSTVQAVSL